MWLDKAKASVFGIRWKKSISTSSVSQEYDHWHLENYYKLNQKKIIAVASEQNIWLIYKKNHKTSNELLKV